MLDPLACTIFNGIKVPRGAYNKECLLKNKK